MFNWYQGRGSKGARTRIFLLEECNKQELQQRDNIIAIMKAGLADFQKISRLFAKMPLSTLSMIPRRIGTFTH